MENISRRSPAVSTIIVAVLVIVLIVVAAGAYVYLAPGAKPSSSSSTTSRTSIARSLILNGSTSAGFYRNSLVTFGYNKDYTCTPALANFVNNKTEATKAAAKTSCEVGGGDATAVASSAPVFILVPAFAGLSIFGVPALGATSQGYPVFNGQLIFTQCGAGGTVSGCFDHPTYVYSSYFTLVEQHLGFKSGLYGLPEGVLPTPAHSHVVDYTGGPSIPWDVIAVLVFDPNVMPDGQTGQCHQWVTSNATNPTANCLTSFTALENALTTKTSANGNANSTQNNPIYDTLGGPTTQVVIPGVTSVSDNSPANTNLFLYFSSSSANPFP